MPAPSRLVRFSLLFSLALVVVLLASPAAASSHGHHLNLAHHKRMVKVYGRAAADDNSNDPSTNGSGSPSNGSGKVNAVDGSNSGSTGSGRIFGGLNGAGADPNQPSPSDNSASASASSTVDPSSTPALSLSLSLGSSSASESASETASSSSAVESSSSSAIESSSSAPTESSTRTTPPASSATPTPPPVTDDPSSTSPGLSTAVSVIHVSAKPSVSAIAGAAQTTSNIRKTGIVLLAIGITVAVVAAAWTLFRKWKLRPSKDFEARIAPVDWQPTTHERDETMLEKQQRRRASGSSFRSIDSQGHSVQSHATGYGSTASRTHDFTAGPSHLAVNGGYADLQRGRSPSPAPPMTQQGGYQDYPRY